jgi:ferredoxin
MDTIDRHGLSTLLATLQERGYRVKGPVVQGGAVALGDLHDADDLPAGVQDEQGPGRYRLHRTGGPALFDVTVPATAWKRFLHPPSLRLFRAERGVDGTFEIAAEDETPPDYAFVGVRPCDLAGIRTLDRARTGGPFVDAHYQARRAGTFIVAVNCTRAGGTCFCDSMGTGPEAGEGYDLVLTELADGAQHVFTVEVGSDAGAEVLAEVPRRETTPEEAEAVGAGIERAHRQMGRTLPLDGVKELLEATRDSAHWDDVAERCQACANCTMACPTCFCTTVEDATDLAGDAAERRQRWDSCFTTDFSYIHGGSVRPSTGTRYRQWITHKLASWVDQFGEPGCVGCGRCITWCPVGIDITAEIAALRGEAAATPSSPGDAVPAAKGGAA